MWKEIFRKFLKRSPSTTTNTSDDLSSISPPFHKSTDSKKQPNNIMARLTKIGTRIREKMGMVDETQSPARVDYKLPDNPRSLSTPSKTILKTQISDPIARAVGLKSTESSTPENLCSSADFELASPCDKVGQTCLAHSASANISHKHVSNNVVVGVINGATQQNMASEEDGNSAPLTTKTMGASGVLSLSTFNKKDRENIGEKVMQGIDHRGLESVGHVANGPFNGEDNQRVRQPVILPHRMPLSSPGAQRVNARRSQRHRTWPGNIGQIPEFGAELGVISARPNQAGPSLPSSTLKPLSRQNSSATSTQSAELDPVLDIGFIDKNGKKQWRILSLDTNSDVNIVAQIVVDKLGLADQIREYNGKDIKGLGRYAHVKPAGQIELTFSVVDGRKTFTQTFIVLCNEDADEFDAIGGLPLVKKEKWLRRGKPGAFMALTR